MPLSLSIVAKQKYKCQMLGLAHVIVHSAGMQAWARPGIPCASMRMQATQRRSNFALCAREPAQHVVSILSAQVNVKRRLVAIKCQAH